MRVRTLLAATAASTMLVAGLTSTAVRADPVLTQDSAGSVVTWGDSGDSSAGPALTVPDDLTALVVSVAANDRATAVVTVDGRLRVWGESGASEVDQAPTDVTDAVSVSLTVGNGAVLHADGTVSAWGSSADLVDVPEDLGATAISLAGGTGYAVTNGEVTVWGADPALPPPHMGGTPADVSAGPSQVLVLRTNGTVVAWGDPAIPEFNTVPDLGGKKVTQIATGPGANGVVLADGTIRVWGPAVPAGEPDFGGEKVISLDLGTNNAGAVTDDGVVHIWGSVAAVNAVPASLDGQPVASIAMGAKHAGVVVAYRVLSEANISGIPRVGQTLTVVTPPSYSLSPATTTGQWYAGTVPIGGQTGTTLKVDDSLVGTSISFHTSATLGGVTRKSESAPLEPVTRAVSTTKLTVRPANAAASGTRTATATVTRTGGIPTGTVTFTAGTSTRIVVLSRGEATWTLPRLATGRHDVTATYSGSPSSAPSTASPVRLKVTKAASKVRASAKATATKVRVTLTVKTAEGVSPRGKVTVTLNGRTNKKVSTRVSATGKATVTITKVKHGAYTAKVKYNGNGNVSGSKRSMKFKV